MKSKILILILIIGFISFNEIYAQDAKEIIKKADLNMRGDKSYSEFTMKTVRPRYTREISMKAWSLGEDFQLVYITEPARDKGTTFLKRVKEMWNYVPSIDKTVKMPPSMMSQSWMGSDFTNDDIVRGVSIVNDYTHKFLRSEKMNGEDCFVIELKPKPDAPIVYEKSIQWISQEHYLTVKVENYNENDELVNTINFTDIKNFGGRKIPSIMELIPEDKPGNKTILITHKVDFKIDLQESFFSIRNLSNIR